jgi:hypothetical protein
MKKEYDVMKKEFMKDVYQNDVYILKNDVSYIELTSIFPMYRASKYIVFITFCTVGGV